MNLPNAPGGYDRATWQQILNRLRDAADAALKTGQDLQLVRGERLILKSPNGSQWVCGPDDAGTWSCEPL